MYKWFVWSEVKMKYLPIPGLFPFSRGVCLPVLTDFFGEHLPVCISRPMFNTHYNPFFFK